jgi:alginate O-acetyltransferase complex protein AlgI
MVFSSIIFLLYFLPVLLITYYLVGKSFKNAVLLVFSIVFYSWGAPKFIFVILATTLLDFYLVRWMYSIRNDLKRKLALTLSVCVNLGLLFYFKYSNFFIENVNEVLGVFGFKGVRWTELVLPIGISFYTFETLTYVVDVYRRVHKPLKNFWDYQLYIILFPKLIAGPIIRYHEIADQISDRSKNENADYRLTGFIRFIIGLSKKVLIANTLGAQADAVFALNYNEIPAFSAWLGILSYTFQIYFDFSGYSDMALGLGKMLGFKFPENFNNPYTSGSITEFWRRWHISLGNWMRNYLYIPLGGNRVSSRKRLYFNLWFVFLASGLWHGASWSFVVWGAFHGFFLVFERLGLEKFQRKIGRIPGVALTFFIVVVGWVFFRIEKIGDALLFIKSMFGFNQAESQFHIEGEVLVTMIFAALFSFFTLSNAGQKIQNAIYADRQSTKAYLAYAPLMIILLMLSIASITASGFNPFIYFRF